ncbi:2'-5' RNA ligase family protein [Phormidium sp. CCY1219]|uniref:2'-5' RNA ligase family protein n=1 Tax=Phormidium sp. CCY1219 TaxID=2886104 RepID=UPI002D1F32AE|nr:2'-5' RNA ligase family protein [Phormidium sp. CCY1219]MEB3828299.1 2'-5' RNA ligase family protein [Phormidium sp. CCY1219]
MDEINRYAIFALLDFTSSRWVRHEQYRLARITQNYMAFCFPVHITIRGRFLATPERVAKAFREINPSVAKLPATISLNQPIYLQPDLAWLEVVPENQGYQTLRSLQEYFEDRVSGYAIADEVPDSHKHAGFRPHITLGWGVTPAVFQKFLGFHVPILPPSCIESLVLVRYPLHWPLTEAVKIERIVPFHHIKPDDIISKVE